MSSKDRLIVSGLYCLARGMQSNDLPTTHRETHSFHPRPYFTRLQCECTCVCTGFVSDTFTRINASIYLHPL